MRFSKFSQYLQKLESTASRNKMTEVLADLFKKADVGEIDKICYLCLGRLAPKFTGIEFNLADKMMIRVLARVYRREEKEIRKRFKELGDLGDVVVALRSATKIFVAADHPNATSGLITSSKNFVASSRPPSVLEVYDRLMKIAQESGEGSVERKINQMAQLLKSLDIGSAKYVVRIPLGRLRLGFSDVTILDALSWMVSRDKSKRQEIERAYNVRTDVGLIAKIIKKKGLSGLKKIKIALGTPIMPALCQRLATAEEMVKKLKMMAVEPKFDGTRLQVHFSKKKQWQQTNDQLIFDFRPRGFIQTFTRDLENTTHMFPDLAEAVFKEIKAQEAILDCEAIGFDPKTGKFLPFQETIKRKRKHDVGKKAKEIPLKFFCFDILYQDGQDLLKTPFNKRRKILEKIISPQNKTIILTKQIIINSPQKLRDYHQQQINRGLEGVVVKKWEAAYDPGRRGFTWVKFKQEKGKKGGGLADTLDCVVMGYSRGKGKRASFGIGAFLVGIREEAGFLTVSKIGTGLTDEQWRELKLKIENLKLEIENKPKEYKVDKNLFPDIWCQPGIVVEIEADNITKSPSHTANYALRFPRLVRFRNDKTPRQTTTLKELKNLYQLQK